MVEHLPEEQGVGGSIPSPSTIYGRLAQLVERLVYTEIVGGSNPSPATINAPVVQLVEAPDLGSGCWEFESLLGHHIRDRSPIGRASACINKT